MAEEGSKSAALRLYVGRLAARSPLGTVAQDELLQLPGDIHTARTHEEFVRLGEDIGHSCLIMDGVAARFAQMEDGRRQIVGLYIPGDMADLYSLMLPRTPSALQALAATTMLRIPHEALRSLAMDNAGVAAALWRDCMVDGGILSQWLINVGRRNARERTAHLFCEMTLRYARIGQMRGNRYVLPMTQEQIADALGLTSVHVNRSLKVLREDGLLQFVRGQVTILDWAGLRRAAEFDPTYLCIGPDLNGAEPGPSC